MYATKDITVTGGVFTGTGGMANGTSAFSSGVHTKDGSLTVKDATLTATGNAVTGQYCCCYGIYSKTSSIDMGSIFTARATSTTGSTVRAISNAPKLLNGVTAKGSEGSDGSAAEIYNATNYQRYKWVYTDGKVCRLNVTVPNPITVKYSH